jgi:hypothetical protein
MLHLNFGSSIGGGKQAVGVSLVPAGKRPKDGTTTTRRRTMGGRGGRREEPNVPLVGLAPATRVPNRPSSSSSVVDRGGGVAKRIGEGSKRWEFRWYPPGNGRRTRRRTRRTRRTREEPNVRLEGFAPLHGSESSFVVVVVLGSGSGQWPKG